MKASVRIALWLDVLEKIDVAKRTEAARILTAAAADPKPPAAALAELSIAALLGGGEKLPYRPRGLDELLTIVGGLDAGEPFETIVDQLRAECGAAVLDEAERAGEIRPQGKGVFMAMFHLILIVAAFVCFALAAFNIAHARVNLVALGLACWVLTLILSR